MNPAPVSTSTRELPEAELPREPRCDEFPLSPGQERLWFLEQLSPGTPAYNLPEAWSLRGRFDFKAFAGACQDLADRHEALRTSFGCRDGCAFQRIASAAVLSPSLEELPDANTELTTRRLREEVRRPFDLSDAPLCRVKVFRHGEDHHTMLLNAHHLISDEWSMGVILADLKEFYRARVTGTVAVLPDLPIQYADFAVWHRDNLAQGALQPQLDYWKRKLSGDLIAADFSSRTLGEVNAFEGETLFHELPAELGRSVRDFARRENVTVYILLLAAFKVLLYRYTRQEDLLVGSLFAGREAEETENVVGFFVNTHALRTRVDQSMSFKQLLGQVREAALEAVTNQAAPLDVVARELRVERISSRQPLFEVLFSLQPGATESWALAGIQASRVEIDTGTSKFGLALLATETTDSYRLRCEFSTARYTAGAVQRLMGQYETFLAAALKMPETVIAGLPLLPAAEERLLIETWNDTSADWPKDKCIHQLFEEQVRHKPDQVALTHDGTQYTYGELNRLAELVSSHLRAQGVGPEARVGLCLRRSVNMVAGMLGILKAGGAYVPIDPEYPAARRRFMLEDSGARLLLTQRDLIASFGEVRTPVLSLEDLHSAGKFAEGATAGEAVSPSNLAYIIYTSGSTGIPKGVALEHRNAVALIGWARNTYTPDELGGVLAATSVCFDLSVFEIFVPLSAGGRIILAPNAVSLPALPKAESVTLINTVPSAMRQLLEAKAVPSSVRVVNLAGEPLDQPLVARIYRETNVKRVFDLYGPSETATYSTGALREADGSPTIGRPLSNERVYVLDPALQPVPIGVVGELFIGGAGVARGYLDRPELTASRFIPSPFLPGDRVYRTGDLARWREDGQLEFLGRADHQVKVRGFRIELGEIEAVLKARPEVADCVAVVRGDRVVAYVAAPPSSFVEADLRRVLSERLPDFMVPSLFVRLDRLPVNSNGKVDRAALPSPEAACHSSSPDLVKPRTEAEETLAAIWQDVLGRNSFGVTDNFFHLGGHSLLAMQVVSRIGSVLKVELPLRTIFEAPTIAELAAAVSNADSTRPPAAPIPRNGRRHAKARDLLKQLDQLSSTEVEELLREWETTGQLS